MMIVWKMIKLKVVDRIVRKVEQERGGAGNKILVEQVRYVQVNPHRESRHLSLVGVLGLEKMQDQAKRLHWR